MSRSALALRYIAFAVVATAANLAAQRAVMEFADPAYAYYPALMAGTLLGLLVKYLLDKRWIFADPSQGLSAHGRKFSLYTLMGVATTIVFWGSETVFWLVWHTQAAREIGAVLGLSVGYLIKYRLDRRFVFTHAGQAA